MARFHYVEPATDEAGNVAAGTAFEVQKVSDGSTATIYAAETGATTLDNPGEADADGLIGFWLENDVKYQIVVGTGGSAKTFPIDPAGLTESDLASNTAAAVTAALVGLEAPVNDIATFTPFLRFETPGSPTPAVFTYGTRAGKYERIGNWFRLAATFNTVAIALNDAEGDLYLDLSGMEFTASAVNGDQTEIPIRFHQNFLNLHPSANNLRWLVEPGEQYARLAYDTPKRLDEIKVRLLTTEFKKGEPVTSSAGLTGVVEEVFAADHDGTGAVDQTLYISGAGSAAAPVDGQTLSGDFGGAGTLGGGKIPITLGGTEFVDATQIIDGSDVIIQAATPGMVI